MDLLSPWPGYQCHLHFYFRRHFSNSKMTTVYWRLIKIHHNWLSISCKRISETQTPEKLQIKKNTRAIAIGEPSLPSFQLIFPFIKQNYHFKASSLTLLFSWSRTNISAIKIIKDLLKISSRRTSIYRKFTDIHQSPSQFWLSDMCLTERLPIIEVSWWKY